MIFLFYYMMKKVKLSVLYESLSQDLLNLKDFYKKGMKKNINKCSQKKINFDLKFTFQRLFQGKFRGLRKL